MLAFGKKFNIPEFTVEQRQIIQESYIELKDLEEEILKKDIEDSEYIELQKTRYYYRNKIRIYNKLLQLDCEDILALLEIVLPYTSIYSDEYLDSYDFCMKDLSYSDYEIIEQKQLKQKIAYITEFAENPTYEIKLIRQI